MLLLPLVAGAHAVRPGWLELRADEAGRATARSKLPVLDGRMQPQTLLLFDLGVPAGPLRFVAAVLGVTRALGPRVAALAHAPLAAAYLVGVPSAYRSTDRITGLLGIA